MLRTKVGKMFILRNFGEMYTMSYTIDQLQNRLKLSCNCVHTMLYNIRAMYLYIARLSFDKVVKISVRHIILH